MIRIYKYAYNHWYDADRAGQHKRAAFWGKVTDIISTVV